MIADVQILEILLIYRRDAPDIRTCIGANRHGSTRRKPAQRPSTSVKPITLLTPPAQLTLVEPNQQNAFYHVRTSDGKEGWVWAKNITLNPPAPTRLGPPEIYPDPVKTPGLANPDITQDNIADNLMQSNLEHEHDPLTYQLHESTQTKPDAAIRRHRQ